MPAITDIRVSIENKDIFVKDEFVKQGEFVRDANGNLMMYAGGFTAVFPVILNGEKWAFRCWHSDLGNVKRRFQIISDSINTVKPSYLCDFEYVDEGIVVNGKIYPTTRMRWVEGVSIKDYICTNVNDSKKLKDLSERFLAMEQDMRSHEFAHGDLQHGNIIVDKKGELYLVDYDSFYCPELKGESDIITGLADYQHPARKSNVQANEKLDYFSELVIYTSILAIAANPNLLQKYQVADSERMLFAAQDYLSFHQSEIYKDLLGLTPKINQLLSIFDTYLSVTDIAMLEPFDVLLDRMNISLTISKNKIRLGKESTILSWSVKKAKSIILYENDKVLQEKASKHGNLTVSPAIITIYKLQVTDSQGKVVVREVSLNVFEEAKVSFESDKQYVFPKIPFTLSWNITNAISVELEGEKVESVGKKSYVDGVDEETTFVLKVTDEFDTKEHSVKIGMLPIPQIKSVLVPTPHISTSVNVKTNIPSPTINMNFPTPTIKQVSLYEPNAFNLKVETGMAKTPEMVKPNFEVKPPNLWGRIHHKITKILTK